MNRKGYKKSDILYHIVKGWRTIILCTFIGLIVGVVLIGIDYIRGEMVKEYKITSSVAVVAVNKNGQYTSRTTTPYGSDLDYARSLTDTAMYIFKSEKTMQKVIDSVGLQGVSPVDISRNLSLNRYGETEIVEFTLMWRSGNEGLEIMKALNKAVDESLIDTLKIGQVAVINEPKAIFIVGGDNNIALWVIIGFFVGLILCILRWAIYTTVINEHEIVEFFDIDTFGGLPFDTRYAASDPLSNLNLPIQDDINSVTHMLINRMQQKGYHKLYITSTKHEEGKTRLLADIAVHLSKLGKKTLLIDCDFNNPTLGTLFYSDLPYENTLNALYRGDADSLDAIAHINGCLDLLPLILEKNPETFNDALLEQIDRVIGGYDYVLIDAAPVGVDAEVLRLNEITDTVLFIVRFDDAKVEHIRKAVGRLEKSGIPIIGGVLNYVVNWKHTILNTPKHLKSVIEKEIKKRDKRQKKKKRSSADE